MTLLILFFLVSPAKTGKRAILEDEDAWQVISGNKASTLTNVFSKFFFIKNVSINFLNRPKI